MFITGPDVVKAVTHEVIDKGRAGRGAGTIAEKAGSHILCVMIRKKRRLLMSIQELLSFLPSVLWKVRSSYGHLC